MQDPIVLSSELTDDDHQQQQQQQHLKCPRCESTNTKFCYYNNYNLSQPRHFCKNCRRYWTKGGALRNIPVGGGSRKNNSKRSTSSDSSTTSPSPNPNKRRLADPDPDPLPLKPEPVYFLYPPPIYPADDGMLEIGGSFSSLLHSNGQFGNFLDVGFGSSVDPVAAAPESESESPVGEFLGVAEWLG